MRGAVGIITVAIIITQIFLIIIILNYYRPYLIYPYFYPADKANQRLR